ncbi:uncharacterized protein LOC132743294 [Ruditapes philippinarum]|uniref:uncharacterized protein LOC132743294 n=1 Tax=Ruditapes philippinarum TaxID=129788 RepID=UPI00295C2250|nr:uncharacterized protein LOC132743294 [Ruditapes philippinarum]
MMTERNFAVAQLPGETAGQTLSISRLRNHRSTNDTSRAQLVSSDVNREPRRPSMSLEPSRHEHGPRSRNTRRGSLQVQRRPSQVTEERMASNALGESIQQSDDFSRTDINRDRRISNGHVARYNNNVRDAHVPRDTHVTRDAHVTRDTHVARDTHVTRDTSDNSRRYSEHSHYHQRPVTEPMTLRDLPPVDVVHRRRDFQGVSSARTRGSSTYDDLQEKDDRYVVPALPMPVAIICCVLNFIIPGFGSMAASLCIFCCAKTEDMTCGEKLGSCCTVFGIGVLQLLLVACFLIGWIWSCIWGITFIGMSASYYHDDDYIDDYYTETNNPAYRGRVRGRTPLPTPQVVEDQPYPGIRYEDIQRQRQRRREAQRRTRSRISLTPSNLIYPMRAPSNIAYNSPPPPYQSSRSPPPAYQNNTSGGLNYENSGRPRQNDEAIEEEVHR